MLTITTQQLLDLALDYAEYMDSIIKVEKYKVYDVNTDKVKAILACAYKEIVEFYASSSVTTFEDEEIRKVVDKYNEITGFDLTI
jgi:ribosome-associated toxin RatA of RatAB toxin-antitoxin module